jgi:hypothetical protein
VAENEDSIKIGELKLIYKMKKKGYFDNLLPNNNNNLFNNMNIMDNNNMAYKSNNNIGSGNFGLFGNSSSHNYNNNMLFGSNSQRHNIELDSMPMASYSMAAPKHFAIEKSKKCKKSSGFSFKKGSALKSYSKKEESNENDNAHYDMAKNLDYDMMEGEGAALNDDVDDLMGSPFDLNNNAKLEKEEEEPEKESKKKEEEIKVEFSNKELVLTQDIFDGFWNLNPQTKLLMEKEKDVYNKIENIMKEKNIEKEEVKITLLVLYYLNTNSSINKVEYMLIIKKGISYLEENGIKFDEILTNLKN